MIAVDTNVVVRFLTRDEVKQSALADECIAEGVFVSDSVMMETEWVLRDAFGWKREPINRALRAFVAVETVNVAQPEQLLWALDRHLEGADFADLVHLAAARGQTAFATFDRLLPKQAGPAAPLTIQVLR